MKTCDNCKHHDKGGFCRMLTVPSPMRHFRPPKGFSCILHELNVDDPSKEYAAMIEAANAWIKSSPDDSATKHSAFLKALAQWEEAVSTWQVGP